jgi:hypothetical protein
MFQDKDEFKVAVVSRQPKFGLEGIVHPLDPDNPNYGYKQFYGIEFNDPLEVQDILDRALQDKQEMFSLEVLVSGNSCTIVHTRRLEEEGFGDNLARGISFLLARGKYEIGFSLERFPDKAKWSGLLAELRAAWDQALDLTRLTEDSSSSEQPLPSLNILAEDEDFDTILALLDLITDSPALN